MTVSAKILDRVQKLLRLAKSDNLHEAANAAAKAQALLDRHRIEGFMREPTRVHGDAIQDRRDQPLDSSKRLRKWKTFLAMQIAPLHQCRVYCLEDAPPGKMRRLVPVGHRDDLDALDALFRYLVTTVECLTRKHGVGRDRKWCDGFRLGAVHSLVERIEQARQQVLESIEDPPGALRGSTTTHGPATLVPVATVFSKRLAQVDRWFDEHHGSSRRRDRGLRCVAAAFAAGEFAAGGVALRPLERPGDRAPGDNKDLPQSDHH